VSEQQPTRPEAATSAAGSFSDHPDLDRFVAAIRAGGWAEGEVLPRHGPACYGCGPDNPAGFGLAAVAAPGGGVRAELTFDDRFLGAPGLAHGGAIAAVLDDLFGMVLIRELLPAVTVDLQVRYGRPIHLGVPTVLTGELVERDGRDVRMRAAIEQHDELKVTADASFRIIDPERLADRYEPLDRR
jgi:acyl-coenzyme A thioesterase PaaI-like protein